MNERTRKFDDKLFFDTADLTAAEACAIIGCGAATLTRNRKRLGIKSKKGRWTAKVEIEVECKNCFTKFTTNQQKNKPKFCSHECYSDYRKDNPEYIMSEDTRKKLSESKIENWKNPSEAMLAACEKLKNENKPEYSRYDGKVRRMSDKIYEENKHLLNPEDHPRTLCGVEGGYQLDHIKSIKECWNEGLSVEEASSLENLQLIPWNENLAKRNFEIKWQ